MKWKHVYKKTYTRVFTVALFVITPILEPSKCTTGECVNRLCQIHTIECCSTVKKNELPVCPPACINVRNIKPNERRQAWKSTFLCGCLLREKCRDYWRVQEEISLVCCTCSVSCGRGGYHVERGIWWHSLMDWITYLYLATSAPFQVIFDI